jgi:hypothetical protein
LQRLLSGKFSDPRIVTEVGVDAAGIIRHAGVKITPKGSRIIDIMVLPQGKTVADIQIGVTKAEDVAAVLFDLKIGKSGARLLSTVTYTRFGAYANKVVPHANWLSRLGRGAKAFVGKAFALLAILGAADVAESEGVKEGAEEFIGINLAEDTFYATTGEAEERLREVAGGKGAPIEECQSRALEDPDLYNYYNSIEEYCGRSGQ